MNSLADLPELVGFFSYSRDDDEGSQGALSALRDAIQRELGAQLGRNRQNFRLWQDRAAIAPGRLWESEIKEAIAQSAFFIPMITPRVVLSSHCRFEFESFLAREKALGRSDLVFPMLYVSVPALENESEWRNHPVLSIVGTRQWIDWRKYRHSDINSTAVREAIEAFCSQIAKALRAPMPLPAPAIVSVLPPAGPAPVEVASRQPVKDEAVATARRPTESDAEARRKAEAERLAQAARERALAREEAGSRAQSPPSTRLTQKRETSGWRAAILPGLVFVAATIAYAGLTHITLDWAESLFFLWFGALDALSLSAVLGLGAWHYGVSNGRRAGTASLAIFLGVIVVTLFMREATFVWWTDIEHWKSVIRWGGQDTLSAVVTLSIAAYALPRFRDARFWAIFAMLWAGLDLTILVMEERGVSTSPYVYPFNRGIALAALTYLLQRSGFKARRS
jgi:TIR domain